QCQLAAGEDFRLDRANVAWRRTEGLEQDARLALGYDKACLLSCSFRQPCDDVTVARRDRRIVASQRRAEVAPSPAFDAAIGQCGGERHRASPETTPSYPSFSRRCARSGPPDLTM